MSPDSNFFSLTNSLDQASDSQHEDTQFDRRNFAVATFGELHGHQKKTRTKYQPPTPMTCSSDHARHAMLQGCARRRGSWSHRQPVRQHREPPSTTTRRDKPREERDMFKGLRKKGGRQTFPEERWYWHEGARQTLPLLRNLQTGQRRSNVSIDGRTKTLEHLHLNTLQPHGETVDHFQTMPAQHRGMGREIASRTESGM